MINEKLINWLEGPGFMYESQGQWPKDISSKDGYVCPNNYSHDEFNENHDKISLANLRNNVDILGHFSKLINDAQLEKNENDYIYVSHLIDEKIKNKEEIKKTKISKINENVNIMVNIGNVVQQSIHKILEHTKYSNFNKLLRITAYVMRFIFNLLCKNVQQRKSGNLNAEEVREAELSWIQVMQRELYDDKQMKWLKKN